MQVLVLWVAAALAQLPPAMTEVLKTKGSYAVSDGSSVYTFRADHTFELRPTGMSGRTIAGVWAEDDGKIRVTGEWRWVNGASAPGDYRQMVVYVSPHGTEPETRGRHVVYPAYLTIESLGPVDAATYAERVGTTP